MDGIRPKTFAEVLVRYQQGERDFTGVELDEPPYADLHEAHLDGADFSGSYIVASFRSASLRRTRFVHANLKTCDFQGADLRDADFSGAALCATSFAGARMEGATFTGASNHSYVLRDGERPDW